MISFLNWEVYSGSQPPAKKDWCMKFLVRLLQHIRLKIHERLTKNVSLHIRLKIRELGILRMLGKMHGWSLLDKWRVPPTSRRLRISVTISSA